MSTLDTPRAALFPAKDAAPNQSRHERPRAPARHALLPPRSFAHALIRLFVLGLLLLLPTTATLATPEHRPPPHPALPRPADPSPYVTEVTPTTPLLWQTPVLPEATVPQAAIWPQTGTETPTATPTPTSVPVTP